MNEGGVVVTWQTIISFAAVLAAIFAIFRYYNRGYDWVKKQKKQDDEIKSMKEEQELLTECILACLKGLKELGCNDTVTGAINKTEAFLNKRAHAHE